MIIVQSLLLNRICVAFCCYHVFNQAQRFQFLSLRRRRLARRRQRQRLRRLEQQRQQHLERLWQMREPWRLVWASLILFLVVDTDCEVDARTGVPIQDGAGALETLMEAGIENKSLKEMMIMIFQYVRQQPRATGTAIATTTATAPRVQAVSLENIPYLS